MLIDQIQNKAKNNWYINSVLHVYLRIPQISSFLHKNIDYFKINKFDSDADNLLVNLIDKAYQNSNKGFENVPVISMNAFRSQLGSEYNVSFPNNEAGDAHSFLNYCHNFLKKLQKAVSDESIYSSVFKINYLVTLTLEEGYMDTDNINSNHISFPAYEIIPLIEKSKCFFKIVLSH